MRILITGTINRPDILKMFDLLANDHQLFFVEYEDVFDDGKTHQYFNYGQVKTWHESGSALRLLDECQPDRVVVLFNSSFNQVALILAARERGVPVIHVEHGFRLRADSKSQTQLDDVAMRQRPLSRLLQVRKVAKNNSFLFRSIAALGTEARSRLLTYLEATYLQGPSTHTLFETAEIRRCDAYISFSPEVFEYHRVMDRIENQPVHFVGIPQFDDFRVSSDRHGNDHVLLVDNQFVNGGFFGWHMEFRMEWAKRLLHEVEDAGLKLFVKTHPGDRSGVWADWAKESRLTLAASDDLSTQGFGTVIGSLSTLMLPFAVRTDTAIISLEIHPQSGHFPSEALVCAGIAHPVFDWEEFREALRNRDQILARQTKHKEPFLRQFLFALDGGAKKRLTGKILDPFDCENRVEVHTST